MPNLNHRLVNPAKLFIIIACGTFLSLASTLSHADEQFPDFSALVESVGSAVVKITIETEGKPSNQMVVPDSMPDSLRKFFENAPGSPPFGGEGVGSGFVISDDGFIVTNAHVVEGGDKITVQFPDDTEVEAALIGLDTRTDVALVKINKTGLDYVKLGDSDNLKVGQWVLAIGSPFGVFDYSATKGIVSALAREMPGDSYVPFIQTDVAVNPGNSGGPLFDLSGHVVGVNSQIYTRSGGFMGLSFAIPSNVVNQVVEQLKTQGYVSRGWLGVTIQPVSEKLAESFDMDRQRGALVADIVAGGPSDDSELEVGDIILSFDGKEVASSNDLPRIVGATPVGKNVTLEILRDGDTREIEIELGELTEEKYQNLLANNLNQEPEFNSFGVNVSELDEEQKSELDLESGLLVTEVAENSPAFYADIKVGDVLLRFNRVKLNSAKDLEDAVSDAPTEKPIAVLLVREGNRRFITVELSD